MFKYWEIDDSNGVRHFKYIGPVNRKIVIPKSIKDISYAFEGITFEEGSYIVSDGYLILEARCAFRKCKFPSGFWEKSKLRTSHCINMASMFTLADLSKTSLFPITFDTSKVENFKAMFSGCIFSDEFYFGEKFLISSARITEAMFSMAVMPKIFRTKDEWIIPIGCESYHMWNTDCSYKKVVGY